MVNIINYHNKHVIKTWLTGNNSCTLVIPKNIAKEYELEKPTHLILETIPEGILIKKLKIE